MAGISKKQKLMGFGIVLLIGGAMLLYLSGGEHKKSGPPTLVLTKPQEIALGKQVGPLLAAQHGGLVQNPTQKALVDRVGNALASRSKTAQTGFEFTFHVLANESILDAFALPGGQIFISTNLVNRMQTEGQLAAVLAHQMAHVVQRDGAKHLAELSKASPDILQGDQNELAKALLEMRYSTAEELVADAQAIAIMSEAGYDPRGMFGVMRILGTAYQQGTKVDYFTTHPNPKDRVANIEAAIKKQYPDGVPETLSD